MSAASTSALSAVLSALNNGSGGLDVTSAVAAVIAADSAPITQDQAEQSTLNSEATEIQQLESEASNLSDSLQSLSDVGGVFASTAATSSDAGVVTASTSAGSDTGSHTVVVNSLATTGSYYSDLESSDSAVLPSGSFQITVGSGTSTTFTTGNGVNTLDQLAATINAAGIGVNASVVDDANGSRLALASQSSGAAANLSISSDTGLQFTRAGTGADASLSVDGVPITSASNTVTGAITGLTLNLQGTNTAGTPATISISPDTSSIGSAVSSFVSSYNTLISDLNSQFTYNTSTSSEGVLSSDSTARSLQSDLLDSSNLTIGSGAITSLASIGVTTNQDGTLSLDTNTLDSALTNNYQGVVNFFQGTNGSAGFASNLTTTLNNYVDPSQGAFTVDLQGISNENTDLTNDIASYQLYLNTEQTTLTTEYNNANIALQQLPQTIKNTQVLLGDYSTGSSGS